VTAPLRRRAFVGLTGTAALTALSGCSGRLPGLGAEALDGDRLAELASRDAPAVPETLPVAVEGSFVADQTAVARDHLAAVPGPFDREEIPNGVIRQRLTHEYESARETIRTVAGLPTPVERLERTGYARTRARGVRAAWRAVESDLTVADVRDSADAVRDDVESFASRWSYVGDDPVRAVVVHAELEGNVRAGRVWTDVDQRRALEREDGPFAVQEVAEDVERARVDVDAGTYLFDRFRASLATERTLRSTFRAARRDLHARIRRQGDAVPDDRVEDPTTLVDRDVGETAGIWALDELVREARYRVRDVDEDDDRRPSLASDVVGAAGALCHLRALERLRERIERGEDVSVSSVDDVVALRENAVAAVEAARETDRARVLTRELLPRYARGIERRGDDQFGHAAGDVSVASAERDAAAYVVAAELCRAVPPAVASVAATLRAV
jgi:hypothetical protein